MTIQGAKPEEIARAIRYSMTVIDAKKHNLDYKRAEMENGIPELRKKYQPEGGASTFLSRSTGDLRIPERKEKAFSKMSPEEKERYFNGEQIWVNTNRKYKEGNPPKKLMTPEEKARWDDPDETQRAINRRDIRKQFYDDGRMQITIKDATMKIEKGRYYDDPFLWLVEKVEKTQRP
jgi:hypothetical protein